VFSLPDLARLHERYAADLALPIEPVRLGEVVIGDGAPQLMSVVNLSPDSTYRESVALSTEAAVRKARVHAAQGAAVVDIGAESSVDGTRRVGASEQLEQLVPVIAQVAAEVVVSVETYEPKVVEGCLAAGARVLNLTGREHEEEMLALAAEYDAAVVLCYAPGPNVRENADFPLDDDRVPHLVDHFAERLGRARELGVRQLLVDPGLGFRYPNLHDLDLRMVEQSRMLLESFRLRRLGVPICNALPHAISVFEDEFRTGEGFFAVLAALGGTHLHRVHEVPRVRAVLEAMRRL
jgi:dihydropteroate synthase